MKAVNIVKNVPACMLTAIILIVITAFASADEQAKVERFKITSYHEGIKQADGECYLVCEYSVAVQPHGIVELADKGMTELLIKAVIVDVIKGKLKRGDKIEYRVYSGEFDMAEKFSKELVGGLRFVFKDRAPDKSLFIDPQNPRSTAQYSPEAETVLRNFFQRSKNSR